jgi:putative tricarboxylic transport membrane protein
METAKPVTGSFFQLVLSRTWGNLLSILLCAYFLWLTGHIPLQQPEEQLPVTTWPKFMLIALIVCMAGKTIETAVRLYFKPGEMLKARSAWADVKKKDMATVIGFLVALPILWDMIGFGLATLIFIISFMIYGGEKKAWKVALISLIVTVALLYLFLKIVYLDLPTGLGFFDDINRYFYKVLHIY